MNVEFASPRLFCNRNIFGKMVCLQALAYFPKSFWPPLSWCSLHSHWSSHPYRSLCRFFPLVFLASKSHSTQFEAPNHNLYVGDGDGALGHTLSVNREETLKHTLSVRDRALSHTWHPGHTQRAHLSKTRRSQAANKVCVSHPYFVSKKYSSKITCTPKVVTKIIIIS